MLAAHHNQENVVQSHQVTGKPGSRQLAPKTPGPRYPKTPMKIPLNDENAPVTGGKGLLGAGRNTVTKKQALATPLEGTRQRAPLGNKTTNAKARAAPAPGAVKEKVQEIEQGQSKQASVQKPRLKAAGAASAKLQVRNDEQEAGEPDIEYIPPRPTDLPYESDVFPDGLLTFEGLKPENLLRGYYERYHDPVEENGVRRKDRLFEERLQKALKEGDERILRDIENTDWSVSDVPETRQVPQEQQKKLAHGSRPASAAGTKPSRMANRRPPTIASRRAASALSMTSTLKEKKPQVPVQARKPRSFLPGRNVTKPIAPTKSQPDSVIGEAASRSTLGYSKGRSASSAMNTKRTFSRTASAASVGSNGSDVTITPANFHKTQEAKLNRVDELSRPQFLSVFNAGEDSDDDGFGRNVDINFDEDEEFQLKLDE